MVKNEGESDSIKIEFDGRNVKKGSVRISVLKSIVTSIHKITTRIAEIDGSPNVPELEVTINPGSATISYSALEGDPLGRHNLETQKGLWRGLSPKYKAINVYTSDMPIKKEFKKIFSKAKDWAQTVKVDSESTPLLDMVEITDSFVSSMDVEEQRVSVGQYIAFMYRINVENNRVGLALYNGEKIDALFPTEYGTRLRKYVKEHLFVRLETAAGSNVPKVWDYRELPDYSNLPEEIEDNSVREVMDRIGTISALTKGWDGHEGQSPPPDLIQKARKYLIFLFKLSEKLNLTWQAPFVSPVANGNIQFEWDKGDKHLEIEFDDQGLYHILQETADKQSEFQVRDFMETLDLVRWILS